MLLRFQSGKEKAKIMIICKDGGINVGKVKTEQIKHLAKELISTYPNKFTTNFDDNKRIVDELTDGATTRVRNQVAGYITRTVTLAQRSAVIEEDALEEEPSDE